MRFGQEGKAQRMQRALSASRRRQTGTVEKTGLALACRIWIAASLALLATTGFGQPARAQSLDLPCPGNRLKNPGFEHGFSARGGLARSLAEGWTDWSGRGVERPRFEPLSLRSAGAEWIQSGLWSQGQRGLGPTESGGLWQRVEVGEGERVLAHAWGRSWANAREREPASSPPGSYALSMGLDPQGGIDAESESLRWTAAISVTDSWLPLYIEAEAEAAQVTIFLRGMPLAPIHNLAAWDAVCLRLADDTAPAAAAPATPFPPTPTTGPGTPSPTPDLIWLQEWARGRVAATERALSLQAKATEWAIRPSPVPAPQLGDGGATTGALDRLPQDLRASGPARLSLWARAYDSMGRIALALAALVLGLLVGLGNRSSS
jgi:hypothetical protein